jgi:hypothetical protein
MAKVGSVLLALGLCCSGMHTSMAAPSEAWVTASKDGCRGLTVGWTPTLAALQQAVGPRWQPAPGSVPGHGLLLLFATACSQSHIGNLATGPFTIGAVIVPVESPADTHGIQQTNGHGWAVITDVLGPMKSPVMRLFKQHGFAVTDAKVRLIIHGSGKLAEPSMSLVTLEGHMEVHARVSGPAKKFGYVSALAGNDPSLFSLFAGPESAFRQDQGNAIVTAGGDTLFSHLGLDARPVKVTLDRDFVWSFEFSDHPYRK